MTTSRRFCCDDLLSFASTNLDPLTETYTTPFYLNYLSRWPDMCTVLEGPNGRIMSYILGKAEGVGLEWRGHVSAVTVAPEWRRLGLARRCMRELERVSDAMYRGYFVDLFVRTSNVTAIRMYAQLGYAVYRRVLEYYGNEDAFDMRKACSRDAAGRSVVPLPRPVTAEQLRAARAALR